MIDPKLFKWLTGNAARLSAQVIISIVCYLISVSTFWEVQTNMLLKSKLHTDYNDPSSVLMTLTHIVLTRIALLIANLPLYTSGPQKWHIIIFAMLNVMFLQLLPIFGQNNHFDVKVATIRQRSIALPPLHLLCSNTAQQR